MNTQQHISEACQHLRAAMHSLNAARKNPMALGTKLTVHESALHIERIERALSRYTDHAPDPKDAGITITLGIVRDV